MKNLENQRFGRQVAKKPVGKNKYGNILWLCKCDCGNEHIVPSGKLVQGKSRSCGCLAKEMHTSQLEKHGITTNGKPRTFIIWAGMKQRCYNPKSVSYKSYGARGISVCSEWLVFENFHKWAMANGYKDDLEIDRIDNDGNYEPSNCRWVTKSFNRAHQRQSRFFEVFGIRLNISQWCRALEVDRRIAYQHLNVSEDNFIDWIKEKIVTGKGQIYFINKFLNKEAV